MEVLSKEAPKKREQVQFFCMEDIVPKDHLLRKVEAVMDWSFIYPLVEDKYSSDNGRPSVDPVILIKMAVIQYMFGIRSMRQAVKEIEVNNAYRWFLGIDLSDPVPHFTTFGKNYQRRFAGTDLFEQIFSRVLEQCLNKGYVKEGIVFVDATHVKANANRNKKVKAEVLRESREYEKELRDEVNRDRETHGKKPFDDDDDDAPPEIKILTQSTTDPESGMFVKGEHERQFAYMVSTGCDKNGFILGYDVCAGNVHDSKSFGKLYDKLKEHDPCLMVMDAGYKTTAILRKLILDGVVPLTPRVDPKTGKGFFYKYEYVYDEKNDWYICPANKTLSYSTTTRDGYREYKSYGYICEKCPHLKKCTNSKNHVKVITQHVWHDYWEFAEDFRLSFGMREVYKQRKETIERVFADGKEKHGMRYTQLRGLARVKAEAGLRFACMNLKKLANWAWDSPAFLRFWCLLSDFTGSCVLLFEKHLPA
jgi:transposase